MVVLNLGMNGFISGLFLKTLSSGGMLALFLDYYFLEDVGRVVDSAHREFTSRNYSDTNYHRHHYQVLLLLRPLGTVVETTGYCC